MTEYKVGDSWIINHNGALKAAEVTLLFEKGGCQVQTTDGWSLSSASVSEDIRANMVKKIDLPALAYGTAPTSSGITLNQIAGAIWAARGGSSDVWKADFHHMRREHVRDGDTSSVASVWRDAGAVYDLVRESKTFPRWLETIRRAVGEFGYAVVVNGGVNGKYRASEKLLMNADMVLDVSGGSIRVIGSRDAEKIAKSVVAEGFGPQLMGSATVPGSVLVGSAAEQARLDPTDVPKLIAAIWDDYVTYHNYAERGHGILFSFADRQAFGEVAERHLRQTLGAIEKKQIAPDWMDVIRDQLKEGQFAAIVAAGCGKLIVGPEGLLNKATMILDVSGETVEVLKGTAPTIHDEIAASIRKLDIGSGGGVAPLYFFETNMSGSGGGASGVGEFPSVSEAIFTKAHPPKELTDDDWCTLQELLNAVAGIVNVSERVEAFLLGRGIDNPGEAMQALRDKAF